MTFAIAVVGRSGGRPNPDIEQQSNKVTKLWTGDQPQKSTKGVSQKRRTQSSKAWPTTHTLRRYSPRIFQACSSQQMSCFVVFCRDLSRFVVMSRGFSGATGAMGEAGRLPPATPRPKPIRWPNVTKDDQRWLKFKFFTGSSPKWGDSVHRLSKGQRDALSAWPNQAMQRERGDAWVIKSPVPPGLRAGTPQRGSPLYVVIRLDSSLNTDAWAGVATPAQASWPRSSVPSSGVAIANVGSWIGPAHRPLTRTVDWAGS